MADVSIIVPNLHSPIIHDVVSALKQQTFDMSRVEILVVGLGYDDPHSEDTQVRFISTGQPVMPSAARNLGMRESSGKYLVFIDADCIASAGWLAKLVQRLESGAHVVSGAIRFDSVSFWGVADNLAIFHDFLPQRKEGERSFLPTTNLAVTRTVVDAVGGMKEHLRWAEDMDWTIRIRRSGYCLHFEPRAVVTHSPPTERYSLIGALRRGRESGSYSIQVRLDYPDVFQMPWFMTNSYTLVALSPLIAFRTALVIFATKGVWRYLYTFPAIFLIKLAWCWGAAQSMYLGNYRPDG
jgi:GT2 family glycosyltransferase